MEHALYKLLNYKLLLLTRTLTIFGDYGIFNNYSIAHEAEWAIDSESMRARGIIV